MPKALSYNVHTCSFVAKTQKPFDMICNLIPLHSSSSYIPYTLPPFLTIKISINTKPRPIEAV